MADWDPTQPAALKRKQPDFPSEDDHAEKIMRIVDSVEHQESREMDLNALKRMVLALERKINKNAELRMKFVDTPSKFMESEVDLDEEIKRFHLLSTAPNLLPELVRLNTVPSILSLLSHENTDIAIEAVSLLNDLSDADTLGDEALEPDDAAFFVDALVDGNLCELLVQNLTRLDEQQPEDRQAVYNTLGIVEHVTEAKPDAARTFFEKTGILQWLLARIKARKFDDNKLYASEVLAVLLQGSKANQEQFGPHGGIDAILQALSQYKKRRPDGEAETEMLENLFDVLCSALLVPHNRELFLRAEGIELMLIMMRHKKHSKKPSCLKVLDFALSHNRLNCEHFVDVTGLKALFSAFMKGDKKNRENKTEFEEHVVSIVASLFVHLTDSRYLRVLGKFVEHDFIKLDRLVELFLKYSLKVTASEQRHADDAAHADNPSDTRDLYLKRLEAGLFTLQLASMVIAYTVLSPEPKIRDHVQLLLEQKDRSLQDVRRTLEEYRQTIGEEDDGELPHARVQREYVNDLVTGLAQLETDRTKPE